MWLAVAQGCGWWPQDQLHPSLHGNASGPLGAGMAELGDRLVLMVLESQGKAWLPWGSPEPPVPAHSLTQWDVTTVDEKHCHGA